MSRKILFRAKRIDNGELVEGCLLIDCVSGQYFIHEKGYSVNESDKVDEEGCLKFFAYEVAPETVCQYTGVKDKSGKEIYEGDIVKDENVGLLGVVKFSERYLQFVVDDIHDGEQDYSEFMNQVEVIGNVYENADLLKEVEKK